MSEEEENNREFAPATSEKDKPHIQNYKSNKKGRVEVNPDEVSEPKD